MYEFLEEFEEMLDNAIQNLSGSEFEELKNRIIERLNEID
jgi:hypothetical protein